MTSENKQTISSLSIIALEYDSDVDTENSDINKNVDLNKSVEVLGYANTNVYRVTGEESSSEDSDSDSSSTSSSSSTSTSTSTSTNDSDSSNSSESDENNDIQKNRNSIKNNRKCNATKVKGELDDLPIIKDLKISVSENSCDLIGEVSWIVESLVIVHPKTGKPTLNLETVLFIDKGKNTLGRIYDVFGNVTDPHYSIRFNSPEHIKENGISIGMDVYYCPNSPYTALVFLHELTKIKGTDVDADAVDNGEAPDFSDDEKELKYYETIKKKSKETTVHSEENIPRKRRRKSTSAWKSNHPWNRNNKNKFQGRKSQVENNDNSNSYNPSKIFSSLNYPNNEFYGYMPYSNNLQTNGINTSIPNPQIHFGMLSRFQSIPSTCFNEHNRFSGSNIRFPHTDLYLQSQQASYATSLLPFVSPSLPPSTYLTPPPPPPPLPISNKSSKEQNHDASQ